jgi:hypothetical protein
MINYDFQQVQFGIRDRIGVPRELGTRRADRVNHTP